jgi:hypothetical protein
MMYYVVHYTGEDVLTSALNMRHCCCKIPCFAATRDRSCIDIY